MLFTPFLLHDVVRCLLVLQVLTVLLRIGKIITHTIVCLNIGTRTHLLYLVGARALYKLSHGSEGKERNDILGLDADLETKIDCTLPRPAAAQSLPPRRCVRGGRHAADILGHEAILPPQQVEAARCRLRDSAAAPYGDQ